MFYFGKTEDPELIVCKGPPSHCSLMNILRLSYNGLLYSPSKPGTWVRLPSAAPLNISCKYPKLYKLNYVIDIYIGVFVLVNISWRYVVLVLGEGPEA